jgi:uncharacterized Tic20 family protein
MTPNITNNITSSDLYHYNTLIKNLEDLQKKIFLGKKHGTPRTPDNFQTKFDILFPNININYRDKITTAAAGTGETSATFHPNNVSLKHLLHNSLYPYLYQTRKKPGDITKIINEHITSGATSKDHLCFIKFNADAATASGIAPDVSVINNILYSICLIDIFIKITMALKNCYLTNSNLFESFNDTTKIYIVEKKLKSTHDATTPRGLFMDTSNTIPGAYRPLDAIYLYIGDLLNIFNDEDIKAVLSLNGGYESANNDKGTITNTFTEDDKLNTASLAGGGKHIFNCLYLYNNYSQSTSTGTKAEKEADGAGKNYENNIYLIRIFLEMIKNIKGGAEFNTTINYLYIYLLCLKSILLSSIRAANIFYNNKHDLDAIAISYDDIFSPGAATSGTGACSALDIKGFVKVKSSITFSDAASCTASTNIIPSDTTTPNIYKYILYRKLSGTSTNETIFKEKDKLLYEAISNTSRSNIDDSATSLGIESYNLFNTNFTVKGDYIITSDAPNNSANSIDNESAFKNSTGVNYESIKNMFILNKTNEFNRKYRIKISTADNRGYKVTNFSVYNSGPNSIKNVTITLEPQDKTEQNRILYDDVPNTKSGSVTIVKITSEDINSEYESIVTKTDSAEQNINFYKTKIKNNTTLYELHKSKNNLLFNQTISYVVIIAIIISVLIIVNIAGVEKSLIKSVTLVCFGAIILLFISYYITNTLYIEEGFSNSDYTGYELCPASHCIKTSDPESDVLKKRENNDTILQKKKDYVVNFLNDNAKELIILISLVKPTIVNDSLKDNNTKLVTMSNNIYNEKKYVKDVLSNKKSDSDMNLDVLRYENKNYDVYIVCILFLSLILISAYTINIYTDNKYLDLLILIITILVVCLFTYFILYSNRIVRTVSTNYYWGKEYKQEYIL